MIPKFDRTSLSTMSRPEGTTIAISGRSGVRTTRVSIRTVSRSQEIEQPENFRVAMNQEQCTSSRCRYAQMGRKFQDKHFSPMTTSGNWVLSAGSGQCQIVSKGIRATLARLEAVQIGRGQGIDLTFPTTRAAILGSQSVSTCK